MSGGVDSSVSAVLLLEQGYEVIGAFMKNWSGTVFGSECRTPEKVGEAFEECGWKHERRDAARVAAKLGIPFVTLDFEKSYREKVVENLFAEAECGRTANPDVLCNKYIKFDLLVRAAEKLGCAYVATGHYARIEGGENSYNILKGVDPNKDQTYFLWAIDPGVLSRVLFPVGAMTKPEVRAKARELGLAVADKKDSTGICFIGETPMRDFLSARISEDPGAIITTEGKLVGTHLGVQYFTIGQRHGLDVGGGTPYYVVEKRLETKELVVSSLYHPALFRSELSAHQTNWFRVPNINDRFETRIRYRQSLQTCVIQELDRDRVKVQFDEPQRAVTPGQSIVFYDGDELIGGGIIE